MCVANLAPHLPRRDQPEPAELLAASAYGLTTVEVAQVCRGRNDPPDVAGTLDGAHGPGRVGSGPAEPDRR